MLPGIGALGGLTACRQSTAQPSSPAATTTAHGGADHLASATNAAMASDRAPSRKADADAAAAWTLPRRDLRRPSLGGMTQLTGARS